MDKNASHIKIETRGLNFFYGNIQALKNINISIRKYQITVLIGPSGCGKLTFLRTLNRTNELVPYEPCSGLDPISTANIEDMLLRLKKDYIIILVPHNIQQASRVAGRTAFLLNGELIEEGPTYQIFTRPKDKRTEDYITGRFG